MIVNKDSKNNLAMIPKRPVLVLDTNVCLDLFVFHDPRWSALLAALEAGSVEAVTREDCRMEWNIVLGYKHLPLDEQSRAQSAARFDGLVSCIAPEPRTEIVLPICRDPDDQKFLQLACDAYADVLITKDKAVLKLAKRFTRLGLFKICLPEMWTLAV